MIEPHLFIFAFQNYIYIYIYIYISQHRATCSSWSITTVTALSFVLTRNSLVNTMGWNERSDPDMRTANFKFSCDVYHEGVYADLISNKELNVKC